MRRDTVRNRINGVLKQWLTSRQCKEPRNHTYGIAIASAKLIDSGILTLLMHQFVLLFLLVVCLYGIHVAGNDGECRTSDAVISKNHPTANFGICVVDDSHAFTLQIIPEDEPINPSPWYGFAVERLSNPDDTIKVTLKYRNAEHRYIPKYSFDKLHWRRIASESINKVDASTIRFSIPEGARLVYVSAQPILDVHAYQTWMAQLVNDYPFIETRTLGFSVAKRPIDAFTVNSAAKRVVVLLGRQHPPEVSGSIAFKAFADKLLDIYVQAHDIEDHRLLDFLRHHMLVFVPLLNPDGVQEGYWRHNLQGKDLNRDWFAQTQPEIRSVLRYLDELIQQGKEIVFHIDFHSTRRDVLYTQMSDDVTDPPDFAEQWLEFVANRGIVPLPEHAPRPLTDQGTAKGYFFKTYAIPSITYEVGDESELTQVKETASEFALALASIYGDLVKDHQRRDSSACRELFCFMVNANGASLLVLSEQHAIEAELARQIATTQLAFRQHAMEHGWPAGQNYLDLEASFIETLGVEASNVHVGRSRQDLHGVARRMLARRVSLDLMASMIQARSALAAMAQKYADTIIPAYTHGVPSQPTSYGQLLLAFESALSRDTSRLQMAWQRLNRSQLGVAAGSGSNFDLDRERLAMWLGFDGALDNTYDANFLSTADYKLELAGVLSQGMATITKFIANVHAQQRNPQPWIYLGDALVSGSSIMPQKRNPRELDRIRTLAAEVLGGVSTQHMLNHNIDTGMHDYRVVNQLVDTLGKAQSAYERFAALIRQTTVDDDLALADLNKGYSTSTDIADTLYREARVPFRAAHAYAKRVVEAARQSKIPMLDVSDRLLKKMYRETVGANLPIPVQKIRAAMDPRHFVAVRNAIGGPAPDAVRSSIDRQREALNRDARWLKVRRAMLQDAEYRLNTALRSFAAQ